MITDYTAEDSPVVVTLDVNAKNTRSHGNRQSTDMNNTNTLEAGNEEELLLTRVTLL